MDKIITFEKLLDEHAESSLHNLFNTPMNIEQFLSEESG